MFLLMKKKDEVVNPSENKDDKKSEVVDVDKKTDVKETGDKEKRDNSKKKRKQKKNMIHLVNLVPPLMMQGRNLVVEIKRRRISEISLLTLNLKKSLNLVKVGEVILYGLLGIYSIQKFSGMSSVIFFLFLLLIVILVWVMLP